MSETHVSATGDVCPSGRISQRRLKELVSYCPACGSFRWKANVGSRARIGGHAGSLNFDGYVRIQLDGNDYRAHRLAWLYMIGEWPALEIDHRNLQKWDNAWSNLRLATTSQNAANTLAQANNTSGYKGVHFHKKRKKFEAYIKVNGHRTYLGGRDTAAEAHRLYAEAVRFYFGEFGRAE